jgi:uncharacterized membrane protein (DUF106 family)
MKTIDEHIKKDESEIQEAKAQGNDSKLHHLEDELNSLKEYKLSLTSVKGKAPCRLHG